MEKYGFVYIWYDSKHKRYYIGCRWGNINDGYICSSNWMKQAYKHRPQDFKRKILKSNINSRKKTYIEEQKWLNLIKPEEIKPINDNPRYYNLNIKNNEIWHKYDENIKTVGQKISHSKKGKSVPAPPDRGAAISASKKGKPLTEEHKAALKGIKKKPHTDEWKKQNSEHMKEQWNDPTSDRRKNVSEANKKRWAEYRLNKQKEQVKLVN